MLQIEEDIRQARFLEIVKGWGVRFPGKLIVEKTGYKSGIVSEYLNSKKRVSESFLRVFCEKFNIDFEQTFGENAIASPNEEDQTMELATIKVLLKEMAKLQSAIYNRPVADCFEELNRNTILTLLDMKKKDKISPKNLFQE